MAVLNAEHLFEQAERLILRPPAGPPRQVDLRRAISAAYYGVFHSVLTDAADELVGITKRNTGRYVLVYRAVDHRALRDLCNEAKKELPSPRYRDFAPAGGFGRYIRAFASSVLELQEKRHAADYDPAIRVKTSDASVAIGTARSAVARFANADAVSRKAFLTLLLFPPRGAAR